VFGTAGHIDHGKSSLVRALTGIDPDRLKEEQERGITIELGFADCDLGDRRVASFVDVPGHERFVRHMVAGAAGIDAVVLVVAADDGVRPQTLEHLAICSLLRVRDGVVAVSKADLVDDEILDVVRLEVRQAVAGTFLAEAPIVAYSARTGEGLAEVREALTVLFERLPERASTGVARLPVDRSFVMHGFGTVVTGTLMSGSLTEGDEVEVLPGGRRARIRGMQVHGHRLAAVRAGRRVAVNLQGIACEDVPRGSTVAAPSALRVTRRIWARLELLAGAPDSLHRGGAVRFHQGTCERAARFGVLGVTGEGELDVELHLERDTVLVPGDRFVLRRPAPVDTVGGGIVLDAHPPVRRAARGAIENLAGNLGAIRERVRRAGVRGSTAATLAAELGVTADAVESGLRELEIAGEVRRLAGRVYGDALLADVERAVAGELAEFHREEPLSFGVSRERLRARAAAGLPQDAWRALLEEFAQRGVVRLAAERVASADHRVILSESDRERLERIETRFREAGLDPPDVDVVVREFGGGSTSRLVEMLLEEGRLVRIRDGRPFHAESLRTVRERLRARAAVARRIDVATFKEMFGVTRRNAIPLLEQLDAERVTRRVGNEREILDA